MIQLEYGKVKFDPVAHTYTKAANGEPLHGITGMLREYVFPDKYATVPQAVLDAAAHRGKTVHADCEAMDTVGLDAGTEQGEAYARLIAERGWEHVATEYLITDGSYWASAIDKVFETDQAVILADIKTTYQLDVEYVRWQLSIYDWLFRLQNPFRVNKPTELYAIWLPKDATKASIHRIEPVPTASIVSLLMCAQYALPWQNTVPPMTAPTEGDTSLMTQLEELLRMEEEIQHDISQLKALIQRTMTETAATQWKNHALTISLREGGTRTSIDTAALSREQPDIYAQYARTTTVKPFIAVKKTTEKTTPKTQKK